VRVPHRGLPVVSQKQREGIPQGGTTDCGFREKRKSPEKDSVLAPRRKGDSGMWGPAEPLRQGKGEGTPFFLFHQKKKETP